MGAASDVVLIALTLKATLMCVLLGVFEVVHVKI
jgi:hypothetical protein